MRRGSGKNSGKLLLFLLSGIIIGTIIGRILSEYINHPIFTQTIALGTQGSPIIIDLAVVSIVFGLTLFINVGTVLGVVLGLIFYFKS